MTFKLAVMCHSTIYKILIGRRKFLDEEGNQRRNHFDGIELVQRFVNNYTIRMLYLSVFRSEI